MRYLQSCIFLFSRFQNILPHFPITLLNKIANPKNKISGLADKKRQVA